MYNHLKGFVVNVVPGKIILETNGVGWDISAPISTTSKISINQECMILIHMTVREDDISLYGFFTEDERSLFRILIGISGVGAATAIQILSSAAPKDFILAIEKQDTKFLKRIKGIGEKTAKRIILELKGAKTTLSDDLYDSPLTSSLNAVATDAVKALEAMGIHEKEGIARIEKVLASGEDFNLEELIRKALQG